LYVLCAKNKIYKKVPPISYIVFGIVGWLFIDTNLLSVNMFGWVDVWWFERVENEGIEKGVIVTTVWRKKGKAMVASHKLHSCKHGKDCFVEIRRVE